MIELFRNLVIPVTVSVILPYLFPDNIVKVTKFHFSPHNKVYCKIRRRRHIDTSDFYAQFPPQPQNKFYCIPI